MNKVLCFGELLLRLSPAASGSWLQTNEMPVYIGGAELNAATALAVWGQQVKYFTALPDNNIARDITTWLSQKRIDISPVVYAGDRIGLYYLQQGTDMKSAGTVFDRKHSSFTTLPTGLVDWDSILEDVSWFHFSAIAPAVSEAAAALCAEALEAASKKNITISVDLNYRSLLWKYGKRPVDIMPDLVKHCHVIMGNLWAANTLLSIPVDEEIHDKANQSNYAEHATATAKKIFEDYPMAKWVANTFRFDKGAQSLEYYATLNTTSEQFVSPVFKTDSVVDKVGSGDCFMAGLIYGISSGHKANDIVSFAAAAAFAKLHEKGDTTANTIDQIQKRLTRYE